MSYKTDPDDSTKVTFAGLTFTAKQKEAMRQIHTTGSMMITDTEALTDESGHKRIYWTDTGATIINDEADNAILTLNADQTATFAAGITLTTGDATITAGTLDIDDGGTVTQTAGDRTNGVTLSKVTGQITVDDDSLAPVTIVKHVVTNTTVAATDVVLVSKVSGDADTSIWVDAVGAGSFTVALRNNAASGDDTTALVYNFVVIKGSSS